MSKLGTPEELLQTEELNDILRVARPATVTDYIAKAIDAVHITPNIVENQNWEKFSEEIRNKYPPVVTHNSHILSTEGARCRAIYTLFSKDKNQSLVDTVDFLKRKWSHDNVVSEILNTQSHIEIQTTKQSTALSELERCLSEDEDRNIEYKSTLTTPIGIAESGVEPPSQITLENACIKTVAGFLNTDGGTLLIGVTDGKDIIGI